jgi:hypothetical protein
MPNVEDAVQVGDAGVRTVSVTIHAVQIGRKQMTQSVFRQLINEPIWDVEARKARGEPWGHINYFWQGCGMEGNGHLHLVWQKGNELRRTCFNHQANYGECGGQHYLYLKNRVDAMHILGEAAILRAFLDGARPEKNQRSGDPMKIAGWDRSFEGRPYDGLQRHTLALECDADDQYGMTRKEEAHTWFTAHLTRIATSVGKGTQDLVTAESVLQAKTEDFTRLYREVEAQHDAYVRAWEAFVGKIRSLDQLFIAV